MPDRNPMLDQLATYPAEALYAKRDALRARGLEVFDFSVGDPREPTDGAIRQAFGDGVPEVSQYPTIRGLAEFRRACADWVSRRFGVMLDPAREILPCSGAKEAVFHLPLCFVDPARRPRVLYGIPGYPVYERGTLFAGGTPWPVELHAESGYRLEPWKLPRQLIGETAVIWINYPHNPTGATVDRAYLSRLAEFCQARDILLCSDECYVDLYLDDESPPSVLELGEGHRGLLAFHSLSKRSGMTGYRSGFIAGDAELIATLAEVRGNFGVASTVPVQRAAIAAWSDDAHAAGRRALFADKRDLFLSFFARAGIDHLPCRATLYLWVEVPGQGDPVDYAERLADRGILVSPAPFHGVDQPYVRLALVPTREDCERAIAIWAQLHEQGGGDS